MSTTTDTVLEAGVPTTVSVGSFTSVVDKETDAYYEELRALGPVVWDHELKAWLIVSHKLIADMARTETEDWRPENVPDPVTGCPMGMDTEDWIRFSGNGTPHALPLSEGPGHDHIHKWWIRAFSPRRLAEWGESIIEPMANSQLDRMVGQGRAEIAADYIEPLVPRVMCALLGLPWDDDEWVDQMFDAIERKKYLFSYLLGGQSATEEVVNAGLKASDDLRALIEPVAQARRNGDGDDFLSIVWREAPEIWPDGYSEVEVIDTVLQAFEGGAGTTASGGTAAFYLLTRKEGLLEEVLAEGDHGVHRLVEETVRLYGPIAWFQRVAKRDMTLGGAPIKAGDRVIRLLNGAGIDGESFTCPHEIDLNRRAPKSHVAFSKGPRTCPGHAVARAMMFHLVRAALERLDGLRADPDHDGPAYNGFLFRQWGPVYVTFNATRAVPERVS
jgi:cytochrome P450